jgi:DNA replication ATP-dependent helicase Dna2
MILLSKQDNSHVGLAQGFLKAIRQSTDKKTLVLHLLLDRSLNEHDGSYFYRIDKINFRSGICLNYMNLNKLFADTSISRNLRELIIDKRTPQFESHLAKDLILKTKHLFKKLNQSQQSAILKTIMAKDYLIIKGYPGTGKTSTIATLIAILTALDKKVLFTSFTNSAVDNLLIKIVNEVNR